MRRREEESCVLYIDILVLTSLLKGSLGQIIVTAVRSDSTGRYVGVK